MLRLARSNAGPGGNRVGGDPQHAYNYIFFNYLFDSGTVPRRPLGPPAWSTSTTRASAPHPNACRFLTGVGTRASLTHTGLSCCVAIDTLLGRVLGSGDPVHRNPNGTHPNAVRRDACKYLFLP